MLQTMYQAKTLVFRTRGAQKFRCACKKHTAFTRNCLPLRQRDLEVTVHGGSNDVEIFPAFGSLRPGFRSTICQRRGTGRFDHEIERSCGGQAPGQQLDAAPSMPILRSDEIVTD
jgi:hypothetical protein